jgi:hypothetical protein
LPRRFSFTEENYIKPSLSSLELESPSSRNTSRDGAERSTRD